MRSNVHVNDEQHWTYDYDVNAYVYAFYDICHITLYVLTFDGFSDIYRFFKLSKTYKIHSWLHI